MLELLGSILTGGATGLIGTLFSNVMDYFKQGQKNKHDLAVMDREAKMLELEIAGAERVAIIESETQQGVAESQAFAKSYATDRATYSDGKHPWLAYVDIVRGLVRPVLTVSLVAVSVVFYFENDDPDVEKQIVMTVLYLTTAAVLWWYGTRARQPK